MKMYKLNLHSNVRNEGFNMNRVSSIIGNRIFGETALETESVNNDEHRRKLVQ
jgi:hypothetical protein